MLHVLCYVDGIFERLLGYLRTQDVCSLRRTSSAYCNLVTARLFEKLFFTFRLNSLTERSRIQALSRIGQHVSHLTFNFPHSQETALPRLLDVESGEEVGFRYVPRRLTPSFVLQSSRRRCAQAELEQILTLHYPALFHQSTDIQSFYCFLRMLPRLQHLSITCPGQKYDLHRKDIVDYALISLRIALEHGRLARLEELRLFVHPTMFLNVRPVPGFGSTPQASRCWRKIRRLHISVTNWNVWPAPMSASSHLHLVIDFIRIYMLSGNLEALSLSWHGERRGPCLDLPMSFHKAGVQGQRLRCLTIRNATISVHQLAMLYSTTQELKLIDVRFTAKGRKPL